ncbi:MAG: rRNA maturation RNase YbeY [Cyanobacteria bacterium P01_F01_bin.33]
MPEQLDLYVRYDLPAPVAIERWQQWFSNWLSLLALTESCELSLILTDDERVCRLNRQFRGIDSPTDVLAFAAREALSRETAKPVPNVTDFLSNVTLGDIVISVPTAVRQASEQRHSLEEELAWLASHGLLHLLGWDHPDERSLQSMLRKQRELLDVVQLCQVV